MRTNPEQFTATFAESNCRKLGFVAVETMYPDPEDEQAVAIGKSVCEGCVAFDACNELGMALELHNDGIFAAQTREERERAHRSIVRNRRNG